MLSVNTSVDGNDGVFGRQRGRGGLGKNIAEPLLCLVLPIYPARPLKYVQLQTRWSRTRSRGTTISPPPPSSPRTIPLHLLNLKALESVAHAQCPYDRLPQRGQKLAGYLLQMFSVTIAFGVCGVPPANKIIIDD